MKINKLIDHTLLKAFATKADTKNFVAKRFSMIFKVFASIRLTSVLPKTF